MTHTVTICECFARDGLQHEKQFLSTDQKVSLLDRFAAAGFRRIEATSYSSPQAAPAFTDASEVLARILRRPGVSFKATCPNVRAVERAVTDLLAGHGADELSLLVSATDQHSERNLHSTRAAQWIRIREMVRVAGPRFKMIGVISMAFGCPFEGWVDPGRVVDDVGHFADLGVRMVTLGDTIGMGTPTSVRALFGRLSREYPDVRLVAHFHDTRGTGITNAIAALEAGCCDFDSAFGGIGGHPVEIEYGSGMTGNVATEDLVSLLDAMGVDTGIDLDQAYAISRDCEAALRRPLYSKVARAGALPRALADRG